MLDERFVVVAALRGWEENIAKSVLLVSHVCCNLVLGLLAVLYYYYYYNYYSCSSSCTIVHPTLLRLLVYSLTD